MLDILLPFVVGIVFGIVSGAVAVLKYIERKKAKAMEQMGDMFEDFAHE